MRPAHIPVSAFFASPNAKTKASCSMVPMAPPMTVASPASGSTFSPINPDMNPENISLAKASALEKASFRVKMTAFSTASVSLSPVIMPSLKSPPDRSLRAKLEMNLMPVSRYPGSFSFMNTMISFPVSSSAMLAMMLVRSAAVRPIFSNIGPTWSSMVTKLDNSLAPSPAKPATSTPPGENRLMPMERSLANGPIRVSAAVPSAASGP